jgi:hypothetical protein
MAIELDDYIAQWGVQYIGGRDPPRVGGQGRRHLGEAAPPETLMGCLPCNLNGPAPGEAAYRGGGNPNGPVAPL